MRERGFNLFTALLSFIIIILSILLTTAMSSTERQTLDTITGVQTRGELQAVADLARADAIQVFNFGLRDRIEDWLSDRERGRYTIALEDVTWQELQKSYAEAKFGGQRSREFADFASGTLAALFYSPHQFGSYSVHLENQAGFRDVLEKAIKRSVETNQFFEVVDCDMDAALGNPEECKSGTFYVTLAIGDLAAEDYEKLPRVVVRNKATGDEVKEIILPRANYRIFVPIRLFKALAQARAIAHRPGVEPNSPEDDGVFSARVHNQIDFMALGMCDKDYCAPRTNPFFPPQSTVLSRHPCPGHTEAKQEESQLLVSLSCGGTQSVFCQESGYDAWKGGEMENALEGMVANGLCARTQELQRDFFSENALALDAIDGGLVNCPGVRIEVAAKAEISKALSKVTGSPEGGGTGFGGSNDPDSCNSDNPGQRVGLFRNEEGKTSFPQIGSTQGLCSGGTQGGSGTSSCAEIRSTALTFVFRETEKVYQVNKKRNLVFEIKLFDNRFTGFAPAYIAGAQTACYVGAPQQSACSLDGGSGWHCKTVDTIGGAGVQSSCEPA